MKYTPVAPFALVASAVLMLFTGTACRKNGSGSGPAGCITRYQPDISKRLIPQAQYDSVKQFFGANGLSIDSLQPLSFYASPGDTNGGIYYQVPTRKLVNGLPLAYGQLKYNFYKGRLSGVDTSGYDFPLETPDSTGHLGLDSLRAIFLASNPDAYANYGTLVALPSHETHWADSCIFATLQYSDKSSFGCCAQGAHVLIKTWSIQRAPDFSPLATIIDADGKIYPEFFETVH